MSVFYKDSGFARTYKLFFYVPEGPTYDAYITYDVLRNRLYIIRFGTLGFPL